MAAAKNFKVHSQFRTVEKRQRLNDAPSFNSALFSAPSTLAAKRIAIAEEEEKAAHL
jgi:hypothetical protein